MSSRLKHRLLYYSSRWTSLGRSPRISTSYRLHHPGFRRSSSKGRLWNFSSSYQPTQSTSQGNLGIGSSSSIVELERKERLLGRCPFFLRIGPVTWRSILSLSHTHTLSVWSSVLSLILSIFCFIIPLVSYRLLTSFAFSLHIRLSLRRYFFAHLLTWIPASCRKSISTRLKQSLLFNSLPLTVSLESWNKTEESSPVWERRALHARASILTTGDAQRVFFAIISLLRHHEHFLPFSLQQRFRSLSGRRQQRDIVFGSSRSLSLIAIETQDWVWDFSRGTRNREEVPKVNKMRTFHH